LSVATGCNDEKLLTIDIQAERAVAAAEHKGDGSDAVGNFHKWKYLLGYRPAELLPGHT